MRNMIFVLALHAVAQISVAQHWEYPATRTEPFDTVIFGTKLHDDYAWLSRRANNDEMLKWARKQGDFTNGVLDSVSGTAKLETLISKVFAPDANAIIVKGTQGEHAYYYGTASDRSRWFMRKSSKTGAVEKLFPLPWIVHGKKYVAKKLAFAHRKSIVALMMIENGEANPHIRFFDLDKRTFLQDSIAPVMFNDATGVSMAWLPGDQELIYSQAPSTNSEEEKYYRGVLKLHRLGQSGKTDEPIFGFGVSSSIALKEYETPYVYSSPGSPYIVARVRAGKGDNYAYAIHYSGIKGRNSRWVKLKDYKCNHGTFAMRNEYLYAVDNSVPNLQVLKVNLATGATPDVFLKESEKILAMSTGDPSVVAGADALYIKYVSPGKEGIMKMSYAGGHPADLSLPFDGTVSELAFLNSNDLLFVMTNWVNDYRYFVAEHSRGTIRAFDSETADASQPTDYITEVIEVPSRDGVSIPVSLVYHRNTKVREGAHPMLIESYGCFGASMNPLFNPETLVWLELGGIYAAAHVRGGSELGARWADAGSYPTKLNSINDVVDVAQYLVSNKITTGDKQALMGASCGTLNVGLALIHRPDLFSAGVYMVGIPDLVTNKGASFGRGQNEFGPLDTREGFESRLSISAYHQIVPDENAPAMLVINGATDYIVPLHNVGRYVAKLQQHQKGKRPVFFLVDWENGHAGAGSSEADMIRKWKFLLWQTGYPDFTLTR